MRDEDTTQLKVAIYLRVSTDDQAKNYGLDMQEDSIKAYIKSKGQFPDGREKMVLAGESYIYRDDGISGTFDITDRPEFARLVEDVTKSDKLPFDIVAVYKVDRFARRLKVLLNIIDFFEKHKIKFLSVHESIDTSNPFGKAILGIMGVIAELELETIKQRTTDGRTKAIMSGKFMGSPRYGYKKDVNKKLEIFNPEAKYVKQIFDLTVFGNKDPKEIADYLFNNKIISPDISAIKNKKRKGKSKKINDDYFWRSDTVKDILKDEIYIGKYYYNKTLKGKRVPKEDWKISPYKYPRIVEEPVFNKAQEILRDSANKILLSRKRKDTHLYLLSGLLKCDYCSNNKNNLHTWNGDRKESPKGSGNYGYYYKCGHKNTSKYSGTCPTIPVPAEQIEAYVIAFIKNLFTNPEAVYKYQNNLRSTKIRKINLVRTREKLIKNINQAPQRQENLKEQHEFGIIGTKKELLDKLRTIDADIKRWNEELSETDKVLGKYELSIGYVKSFYDYAKKYKNILEDTFNHKEEVYKLIHSLIDSIVVVSRPLNPKFDKISGRKKLNQQIPESVRIVFKLPRSLMFELVKQETTTKFGVKTDAL